MSISIVQINCLLHTLHVCGYKFDIQYAPSTYNIFCLQYTLIKTTVVNQILDGKIKNVSNNQ